MKFFDKFSTSGDLSALHEAVRDAYGSARAFAGRTGVHQVALSRFFAGQRALRFRELEKIAKETGLKVERLREMFLEFQKLSNPPIQTDDLILRDAPTESMARRNLDESDSALAFVLEGMSREQVSALVMRAAQAGRFRVVQVLSDYAARRWHEAEG